MFDNDKYTDRDLREMREIALDRAQIALAKKRSGDLTPSEGAELDALLAEVKDLGAELDKREAAGASQTRKGGHIQPGADGLTGMAYRAERGNREFRMLKSTEKLADIDHGFRAMSVDEASYRLGIMGRGMVTGQWPEQEQRVLTSAGDGQYLIPSPLSATVIDTIRATAKTVQAGVQTIPMEAGTLRLPRQLTDPTGYFRGESAAITASVPTFDAVDLTAFTCGFLVKLPAELFEDSELLGPALYNSMAAAAANEIDRCVLQGAGTTEPQGIIGGTSVGTTAISAAPTTAHFNTAVAALLTANAPQEGLSAFYSARTWGDIDAWVDGESLPITPDKWPSSMTMLKHYVTNQISDTTGGANSTIVIGHFPSAAIGLRRGITMKLFDAGYDKTTDAVVNYEVWLRGIVRFDVALLRPSWFYTLTGVTS